MKVAYLDTSCLVAIAFGEPGADALARLVEEYDVLLASNLLEAELRSAFAREDVPMASDLLAGLSWVFPERRLTAELDRALAVRYQRGADLWHVATALYVAEVPGDVDFLTLDGAQRDVAASLGFQTPA